MSLIEDNFKIMFKQKNKRKRPVPKYQIGNIVHLNIPGTDNSILAVIKSIDTTNRQEYVYHCEYEYYLGRLVNSISVNEDAIVDQVKDLPEYVKTKDILNWLAHDLDYHISDGKDEDDDFDDISIISTDDLLTNLTYCILSKAEADNNTK